MLVNILIILIQYTFYLCLCILSTDKTIFTLISLDKSPVSLEDKAPDSVCDNSVKKNTTGNSNSNTNRAKKRKKTPRDATAPKQPLTGYFR